MRAVRSERRSGLKRNLILIAAALVLVGAVYGALRFFEERDQIQERGLSTAMIGQRRRVEYGGKSYAEKTAMTSVLIMGVDQEEGAQRYGARQGGQADFLLLLVIDHTGKVVSQLQIDRDTITPVEMLGVLGNPIGTRSMQVSLSHGFGRTEEDCCANTVKAVENLLEGQGIDYYMSLNMSAMRELNNVLGGVTVTLEQDFSEADPAMTPGATLRLTDGQAEIFLRSRMSVGEGTNEERMTRQRAYMSAAVELIRARLHESPDFAGELFDRLEPYMTTSMKRGRMINEISQAFSYETLPVATLEGEHTVGRDGFMEFHAADGAAARWVMQTFYDLLS